MDPVVAVPTNFAYLSGCGYLLPHR